MLASKSLELDKVQVLRRVIAVGFALAFAFATSTLGLRSAIVAGTNEDLEALQARVFE